MPLVSATNSEHVATSLRMTGEQLLRAIEITAKEGRRVTDMHVQEDLLYSVAHRVKSGAPDVELLTICVSMMKDSVPEDEEDPALAYRRTMFRIVFLNTTSLELRECLTFLAESVYSLEEWVYGEHDSETNLAAIWSTA